jgi:tetratricopeptide (TPR) repeat protein
MLAPDAPADATQVAAAAPGKGRRLVSLLRSPRLWAAVILLGLVAAGIALAAPQLTAWYHLRAAHSALERYHNPEAVRHLQECLRIWPADPDVLLLAARAARRGRSHEEAERFLEKYQQARGLDEAGSFEQLLLSAERRVDQVAAVCRHHVEHGHPDAPLILEALTRGYLRQYRLGEARFCLDRWRQLQPDNVQALCFEGELHLDYEHARTAAADSYRQALQLDPEHEEARLGLAIALVENKRFAEAAEQIELLRAAQPDNLRLAVGLAECRDALGDAAAAGNLVESVLARDPHYAPALALRGRLAAAAGDYATAEDWLRQALARNPADYQARYHLVLCLHRNGKDDEAKRQKDQVEQMKDDLKRFEELINKEIRHRPLDPTLHYQLGQLLLRSGHQAEGLRWLHSALRQDPQYTPARQALAEHYRKAAGKQPQDP